MDERRQVSGVDVFEHVTIEIEHAVEGGGEEGVFHVEEDGGEAFVEVRKARARTIRAASPPSTNR